MNPRVFSRTYWLLQNIRCSSLLTNAMLVLTRDIRTPFLLGKTDYFVYEKNESRNHFNFIYFVQKKIFSGRNHELTKDQHMRMPRNFLSEIFRISDAFFASGICPLGLGLGLGGIPQVAFSA